MLSSLVRQSELWVPAQNWYATTTAGAASGQIETAGELNNIRTWDFDQTTTEYIATCVLWPAATAIGATVYWTASAGTGGVRWGLVAATAAGDGVTLDDGAYFGYGLDTLQSTGLLHTVNVLAFAVDPAPIGALAMLRIVRDTGNAADTLNADARFIGALLTFK